MNRLPPSQYENATKAAPAADAAPPVPVLAASARDRRGAPAQPPAKPANESTFLELRRKVQAGELLSSATERLLHDMKFNGHLTVMVQHGRVVKSGYEEGYFRRTNDLGGVLHES